MLLLMCSRWTFTVIHYCRNQLKSYLLVPKLPMPYLALARLHLSKCRHSADVASNGAFLQLRWAVAQRQTLEYLTAVWLLPQPLGMSKLLTDTSTTEELSKVNPLKQLAYRTLHTPGLLNLCQSRHSAELFNCVSLYKTYL